MTKKNVIRGAFAITLLAITVQTTLSFSTKEVRSHQAESIEHSYHSGYTSKNNLPPTTIDVVSSQSTGGPGYIDQWHTKHAYSFDQDNPLIGYFASTNAKFGFPIEFLRPWYPHSGGNSGLFGGGNFPNNGNQHSPSLKTTSASGATPSNNNGSNAPQGHEAPDDEEMPSDKPTSIGGPGSNVPSAGGSPNPDTFDPVVTDPSKDPVGTSPEQIIEKDPERPNDTKDIPHDSLDPSCVIRPEGCLIPGSQSGNPKSGPDENNVPAAAPDGSSTAVPEPESFALLFIGLLGFKLIRSSKK